MCRYTTERLWWRKLPPPVQRDAGSPRLLPPPPLLHPLPPLLHLRPLAKRTGSTAGQKSFSFLTHIPSLTGRMRRCSLMCWKKASFCGWHRKDYMPNASAGDVFAGRALQLHIQTNPTNWRRSSHAKCLTPSISLLVSMIFVPTSRFTHNYRQWKWEFFSFLSTFC